MRSELSSHVPALLQLSWSLFPSVVPVRAASRCARRTECEGDHPDFKCLRLRKIQVWMKCTVCVELYLDLSKVINLGRFTQRRQRERKSRGCVWFSGAGSRTKPSVLCVKNVFRDRSWAQLKVQCLNWNDKRHAGVDFSWFETFFLFSATWFKPLNERKKKQKTNVSAEITCYNYSRLYFVILFYFE